ncbi:MAG TPA: aminotransferase class III-fold pyridoxal phosphate-dependent enzyme [Longimicrobiales bacterium]|nr:aminotransferase class III-fold pyridoxal phosphate-dependent enzyme [Longimicrobiales bacterium]
MVGSRQAFILQRITRIISEMSGLAEDAIDPGASFLDLGFDSLFLTQANLRFRRELGVKITFRQLFDEAPCPGDLARYVDGELPAEALREEMAAAAGSPAGPADAPAVDPPAGLALDLSGLAPTLGVDVDLSSFPGGLPNLLQVLILQNQTNTALLQALAGGNGAAGAGPARGPESAGSAPGAGPGSSSGATAPAPATPTPKAGTAAPAGTPAAAKPAAKAFGPYKPVEQGSGGLDDEAREALDRFCREYADRTRSSKELAEAQRPVLSDARSISGFRRDWKEIVYQIAQGRSKGVQVWDLDGNEYIDMTSSFGISLFGHQPDWAVEAAKRQIDAGFELGTLSPLAYEAAKLIRELTGMDRSTFTNTGSEALAAAVRAARTATAKDRIAVFYDEYHGIGDELLVNALDLPGGRRTIPTSPGIPDFIVENVLVLKWDDPDFIGTIREHADELAAVIIEPVQNRNPSLKTSKHFQSIRAVTREHNIAMIFDEMITGFRLAPGGAQEYFGVEVDIACYGKILSGGLPCATVSGRGHWLDCFDGGPWQFGDDSFPEAGVTFFGGTFTRHPVALATCHAALKAVKEAGQETYDVLNAKSRRFAHRLNELLIGAGYPARIEHCESVFNLKWDDANPFSRLLLWQLRHRGVLIYDRPFFMTTAHTEADLDRVFEAFRDSVAFLLDSGIVPRTALSGDTGGARALPFSRSQMEVWLATRLAPEASRAFHEQVIYDLEGPVDLPALRHAVQRVVHRHEGLRAREDARGEGWIIEPAAHISVKEVDLTGLSEAAREAELARAIRADVSADFDLVRGPLVRFTLYRTGPERSTLVIAGHHLVIDGWSMGIVLQDLARYYTAACRSERFGAPAPHSLTTFLADEMEYLESEDFRETEAFWVEQFQDVPDPLQLPLDRPRPATKSYNGHRQSVRFDPGLMATLEDFCAGERVTTFTTLYAAFSVLMAHLTDQEDVVVGVPMAGQAVAGQPTLVGHAVNFLPLRMRIDLDQTFRDVLLEARDYILELNDHQRYTYASLLRKLPVKRTSDQMPLVSVTFNVDQGMESFDFNGVDARYVTGPRDYVKHDLFVNVVLEEAAPILEVDHNGDILDAATARGWMDAYFELLRRAMADPSRTLRTLVEAAAPAAVTGRER